MRQTKQMSCFSKVRHLLFRIAELIIYHLILQSSIRTYDEVIFMNKM